MPTPRVSVQTISLKAGRVGRLLPLLRTCAVGILFALSVFLLPGAGSGITFPLLSNEKAKAGTDTTPPTAPTNLKALNPSFNNTGLTANTTYTYYVIAYDAAGNASPKSASVSATTAGSVTITVSNVAVSNVATSSATIAFTTNVAASTDILYGTNGSYNNSDPGRVVSHDRLGGLHHRYDRAA